MYADPVFSLNFDLTETVIKQQDHSHDKPLLLKNPSERHFGSRFRRIFRFLSPFSKKLTMRPQAAIRRKMSPRKGLKSFMAAFLIQADRSKRAGTFL
ncbi:MAG TPA: hypothetical protein DC013_04685 [Ruminococcaceae bacterium]|nr:hypothetical protein [Oscillospiraceae bacterium]